MTPAPVVAEFLAVVEAKMNLSFCAAVIVKLVPVAPAIATQPVGSEALAVSELEEQANHWSERVASGAESNDAEISSNLFPTRISAKVAKSVGVKTVGAEVTASVDFV